MLFLAGVGDSIVDHPWSMSYQVQIANMRIYSEAFGSCSGCLDFIVIVKNPGGRKSDL